MNKKFIASVLALTMLVGMSAPVMAGTEYHADYDGTSGSFTVSGDGTVQKPNISVTVPTQAAFVINPYGVGLGEEAIAKAGLTEDIVSGNRIISKTHKLVNESDVNIAVSISDFKVDAGSNYIAAGTERMVGDTVSGSWIGGFPITVAKSSVAKKKNAVKSIFIKMELDKDIADTANKVVTIKGASAYKYVKNKGVQENDGAKKARAIVIPKDKTGSITLKGDVNESPVKFFKNAKGKKDKEDDKWSDADDVSVSYKLTITPTTLTK